MTEIRPYKKIHKSRKTEAELQAGMITAATQNAAQATRERISFIKWIEAVETILRQRTGLGRDDFPDYAFRQAYHDHVFPELVVSEMIDSTNIIIIGRKGKQ